MHLTNERAFLEVIRFDRVGRFGQAPMNSLGVVDDEFFGRRDNWIAMADRLTSARMLSTDDAAAIRWFSAFGTLIANTDQHFGNISLIPENTPQPKFRLAPAY
ncbi:MAG: HipA domain-containing protein, partial [Verrucomicrobia bacterium]|nr:HipA domain-containing protein [Deltaproteobacteria bacterium]